MKLHSRWRVFPVFAALAVATGCLALATTAVADVLVTNEFQATSSSALETTPTLGSDTYGRVLVFTSVDLSTFGARVFKFASAGSAASKSWFTRGAMRSRGSVAM